MGQSAVVFKAVDLSSGRRVAAKVIPAESPEKLAKISEEFALHRRLSGSSAHILTLLDYAQLDGSVVLFLEPAATDLFELVVRADGLSEPLARQLARQMLLAVTSCHAAGVFHRDLKPENFLLDSVGQVKLCDFGLSAAPSQPETLFVDCVGTLAYAAPEVLAGKAIGGYALGPTDVWSLGVCLFCMVGGLFPFEQASKQCKFFLRLALGKFEFPSGFSPELRDLLLQMWRIEPSERIRPEEISGHPWMLASSSNESNCESSDSGR